MDDPAKERSMPLHKFAWPAALVEALMHGTPAAKVDAARLGALLETLPPPYHYLRYNGDEMAAFTVARSAFRRLRTHRIESLCPLDVDGCGNRMTARASVGATKTGAVDLECAVVLHLVQELKQPGVAGSNNLSNFFMEDLRLQAQSLHSAKPISPAQYWATHGEEIVEAALEESQRKEKGLLEFHHFSKAFFKSVGQCTCFRPMVAMHMYQGAEVVLDMCGGWGDRLLAILATRSVRRAVVVDPEGPLHARYAAMRALLRGRASDPDFQLTTLVEAFEDLPLPRQDPDHAINKNGPYCVAFTSPPFRDRETYSSDKRQSNMRYPTMQGWIQRFLIPMARSAFARVRVGGIMGLAMSDYTDVESEDRGRFTADVITAMQRLEPRAAFRGVIHFSLVSAVERKLRHMPQPIFVWQRVGETTGGAAVIHPVFSHEPAVNRFTKGASSSLIQPAYTAVGRSRKRKGGALLGRAPKTQVLRPPCGVALME